jgi:endo-1,4-beta-xylanase
VLAVSPASAVAGDAALPEPGDLSALRAPARVSPPGAGEQRATIGAGGAVRLLAREVAADRVVLRVRRGRCAHPAAVLLRVDGRAVLRRTVRRRTGLTLRAPVRLRGGDHRIDLAVHAVPRARCRVQARLDHLGLRIARRRVPVGAAVRWSDVRDAGAYRDTFLREFDSLTPENEMKMLLLRPDSASQYAYGPADALVDLAQRSGKAVRGHALVWGLQLPPWLSSYTSSQSRLAELMREHVASVASHFRGRVGEWDVVNEPLSDDGTLADNLWSRRLGPGYVEMALRAARDADPTAKLFINEVGTELNDRKFDALMTLAGDLLRRGVPLDGIGLQNHAHIDLFATRARLAKRMRRIAALGLEVQITEMDVSATSQRIPAAQRPDAQADVFAQAAAACNEVPACTRFTTWGVGDRVSWLGPQALPLLFDDLWGPKPALRAVRAVFAPR